jgi:hypothetical protein
MCPCAEDAAPRLEAPMGQGYKQEKEQGNRVWENGWQGGHCLALH